MQINVAHIRERAVSGGWVDYAVFEAKPRSMTTQGCNEALTGLMIKARQAGLKIDQAALAFMESGRVKFFGTDSLVKHLSRSGLPRWTHKISM